MKEINESDLDLFEVTSWLWVTSKGLCMYFDSNDITKINYLIRHLLSIIDSWLIEKICASKPNHTVAIPENILELVTPWYMFWVYLEPDWLCFFQTWK